jgi:hypothetical protein
MANQGISQGELVSGAGVVSRRAVWGGRVVSGLAAAFFVMDGGMKLGKPAVVLEATRQLGYPESSVVGIGMLLLVCTVLYLLPRTSIVGAIVLTGYLGGAVASHVRVVNGWFSVVFPVVFGVLVWGGLWLRDGRVRGLFREG